MEYKLFAVRVFVTDWKRAIRFYSETLGMTIAYQSDEMGWAQMAPGEGQLALERVDPSDEEGRALVGRFVGQAAGTHPPAGVSRRVPAKHSRKRPG